MTVTFDSSAWIEYFAGSKQGKIVKKYIERLDTIYTPSIAIMEIKSKYQREGKPWQTRIDYICERSIVVKIDTEIALLAADLKKKYGLYSIDALIYAVSLNADTTLLTRDHHFDGLKNTIILN